MKLNEYISKNSLTIKDFAIKSDLSYSTVLSIVNQRFDRFSMKTVKRVNKASDGLVKWVDLCKV